MSGWTGRSPAPDAAGARAGHVGTLPQPRPEAPESHGRSCPSRAAPHHPLVAEARSPGRRPRPRDHRGQPSPALALKCGPTTLVLARTGQRPGAAGEPHVPVGAEPRSRVVRGWALRPSPTHAVACGYVSGHPWGAAGWGPAAPCFPRAGHVACRSSDVACHSMSQSRGSSGAPGLGRPVWPAAPHLGPSSCWGRHAEARSASPRGLRQRARQPW